MRSLPTAEMPKALERAAEAARERERELAEAEAALVAAEENVEAGRQRDVEAVAAAREAGQADPPPQHEEEARQALAAATTERDVRAERSRMADGHVEELLAEQADTWRGRVEKGWTKADTTLRRKLAEIEAALAHRADLAACWAWLRATQAGEDGERVLRKSTGTARLPDLQELHAAIDQREFATVSDRVETAEREEREARAEEQAEFEERLAQARAAQERQP